MSLLQLFWDHNKNKCAYIICNFLRYILKNYKRNLKKKDPIYSEVFVAFKMEARIQMELLILSIALPSNILVETTDFAEKVVEIEKEIEAIEPVQNVIKAEEIREHLNQFYKETCSPTEAMTYRSYFTPNVRVNTGGKRVSRDRVPKATWVFAINEEWLLVKCMKRFFFCLCNSCK